MGAGGLASVGGAGRDGLGGQRRRASVHPGASGDPVEPGGIGAAGGGAGRWPPPHGGLCGASGSAFWQPALFHRGDGAGQRGLAGGDPDGGHGPCVAAAASERGGQSGEPQHSGEHGDGNGLRECAARECGCFLPGSHQMWCGGRGQREGWATQALATTASAWLSGWRPVLCAVPLKLFGSSSAFRLPDGSLHSSDASAMRLERWQALTAEQRRRFPPLCPSAPIWWWSW